MARPVFADPKMDFVFHRIFGSDDHKTALLGFLNDMLDLEGARRIEGVTFLSADQRPKVAELKFSIVDVKCIDARGTTYVVEMQVLNVEAFEKRVVYNVAKAYTNQLEVGEGYPKLDDVIGISICDFELWPHGEGPAVPMRSRWRMQEQSSGVVGLPELEFVFLELPKYAAGDAPVTHVDKWAYFFREARNLKIVPPALDEPPLREALDAARTAGFTTEEWDLFIRAGMALQDERDFLPYAERRGLAKGLRAGIEAACELLGVKFTKAKRKLVSGMNVKELEALLARIRKERRWD